MSDSNDNLRFLFCKRCSCAGHAAYNGASRRAAVGCGCAGVLRAVVNRLVLVRLALRRLVLRPRQRLCRSPPGPDTQSTASCRY